MAGSFLNSLSNLSNMLNDTLTIIVLLDYPASPSLPPFLPREGYYNSLNLSCMRKKCALCTITSPTQGVFCPLQHNCMVVLFCFLLRIDKTSVKDYPSPPPPTQHCTRCEVSYSSLQQSYKTRQQATASG